jgi:hypothetical protein
MKERRLSADEDGEYSIPGLGRCAGCKNCKSRGGGLQLIKKSHATPMIILARLVDKEQQDGSAECHEWFQG